MDNFLDNLKNVPEKPGVYLWKNSLGRIIYVGKAKMLRKRMIQYFRGMQNSFKTQKLVTQIADFDYVITRTEQEALILERNLIESHAPQFNILLTDDKRYPYIKVSLSDRLEVRMVYRVRSERRASKVLYFGPFPTGFGARNVYDLITRIALYDKGIMIRTAPAEYWTERFTYIKRIFTGEFSRLITDLKNNMDLAAEHMQYEVARDIKEVISALEFYRERQVVELIDKNNLDIIGFAPHGDYLSVSMLFYRQGVLLSKRDFLLETIGTASETASQFVSQYYAFNIKPDAIISNLDFVTDAKLIVPEKGQYQKILSTALQNANDNIEFKINSFKHRSSITGNALILLSQITGINPLEHVVMVDNSNLIGTNPVSVVVSYRHGIKQPRDYRKYDLKDVNITGDPAHIAFGLGKFLASTHANPDLIIVDGGKAQINAARTVVPESLPIIGLVKDDKHQTSYMIDQHGKTVSDIPLPIMNFFRNIQTEVDRYAKSYHNKRTTSKTLEGRLIDIPGIGVKTEQKLLQHFQTYAAIYNADLEALSTVVSPSIAKAIKNTFKDAT